MSLTKEVQEAIEKGLPAQTAGVLKARLDLIDSLETKCKSMESSILSKDTQISTLTSEKNTLTSKLSKVEDILKRESEVKEREFKLELLNYQVQSLKDQLSLAERLFSIPFANRVVSERINGYAPCSVPAGGHAGSSSIDLTKTTVQS